ncbi:MAG: SPOR domain-containing protein [Myxococcales bacterium]|nr:SPOR domain-containing protein [Myxococcales bacterium]
MDTGMRDLEQIQEHEGDEGGLRRGATIGLAAAVIVGLILAMASLLGGATASADLESGTDPLAALARAAESRARRDAAQEPVQETTVDRASLTFPEILVNDDRPEVAAALAAAAAEYAHPEPIPAPAAQPSALGSALAADLPAGASVGPEREHLSRTALLDPMVSAALPSRAPTLAPVSAGSEGRYTLQVISYREAALADEMADLLRGRGHHAFVTSADIPDRGVFYRVRVGPFESQREAQAYRADFETSEGMITYVVRRRD